jgi:hypothetical protein
MAMLYPQSAGLSHISGPIQVLELTDSEKAPAAFRRGDERDARPVLEHAPLHVIKLRPKLPKTVDLSADSRCCPHVRLLGS